jgi:hypothetical protein
MQSIVACAYDPSYSGGRDQSVGSQFEASLAKKLARPYLNQQAW